MCNGKGCNNTEHIEYLLNMQFNSPKKKKKKPKTKCKDYIYLLLIFADINATEL